MNTYVIVSIDGLGIGYMPDSNIKANTWKTLLKNSTTKDFDFLKKIMKNAKKVSLDYKGADSYLGHLTMSGIKTNKLDLSPLSKYKDEIIKFLNSEDIPFEIYKGMIIVKNAMIIYDNFEADHGLAINIIGSFDAIDWESQLIFSQKIRNIIKNPRLISFGAHDVTISDFKKAYINYEEFNGIKTPETGVYNKSFIVKHLAEITDFSNSIQYKLSEKNEVWLYGKFANIINLEKNNVYKFKNIDEDAIFKSVLNNLKENSYHFINIQQTDLAGHLGDVKKYIASLNKIDNYLKTLYNKNIKLIIISDHGNDPSIKDGKHNREFVPLITNFPIKLNENIKLSDLPKILI